MSMASNAARNAFTRNSVAEDDEIPGFLQIQRGEDEGWDAFYSHYIPILIEMIKRARPAFKSRDRLDPEETAYELLAKLYCGECGLLKNGPNSDRVMRGYLRKMVHNYEKDLFRKQSRMDEVLVAEAGVDGEDYETERREVEGGEEYVSLGLLRPDRVYQVYEIVRIYGECRPVLSRQLDLVIRMTIDGASDTEIAAELGVSVKSVGVRRKRARERLKRNSRGVIRAI